MSPATLSPIFTGFELSVGRREEVTAEHAEGSKAQSQAWELPSSGWLQLVTGTLIAVAQDSATGLYVLSWSSGTPLPGTQLLNTQFPYSSEVNVLSLSLFSNFYG